jgi:hypothetical protein
LFNDIFQEPCDIFAEDLLLIVDVKDYCRIDYRELFHLICMFAFFDVNEMVKVIFYMFDREKKGHIAKVLILLFLEIFHENG